MPEVFRFDVYEFDPRARTLRKSGHKLRLQEHSFKILATLLDRPGEVVSREELRTLLWPDGTTVDFENGLNAAMGKLRQALRDSAGKPRYIETVPRRGYRFVGTLEPPELETAPEAAPVPVAAPARTRRPNLAWVIAAAALLLFGGYFALRQIRRGGQPAKHVLAVLPFQTYDPDPEQRYLADGLTEEMTSRLANLSPGTLSVIARTTAAQYGGAAKSIAQMAGELAVDYVLEGSIRPSHGRVRVSAQLIRAAGQTHVWAGDYDRALGDVLTMEVEIAQTIAAQIRLALTPEAKARLGTAKAVNPAAYDAYLRGRYLLWNQSRSAEDLARAAAFFEKAIHADPLFAPAYAGLAEYHWVLPDSGAAPVREHMRLAAEYAGRSLAIDESVPVAHMTAGAVATFTRHWSDAGREFRRALELDPTLVRARAMHAVYLLAIGRPDEAVAEIREARKSDPLSLTLRGHVQRTLYLAHHFEEAIEECRKSIELDPLSPGGRHYLALSLAALGRHGEALRLIEGDDKISRTVRVLLLAGAGRRAEAMRIAGDLRRSESTNEQLPFDAAVALAQVGRLPEALAWLEKAEAAGDPTVSNRLLCDPRLDPLRGEPRFNRLIAKMNYPR
jgi:TolB-like protein/DNA-binding winged helix-turn-helix (wHTH) protein